MNRWKFYTEKKCDSIKNIVTTRLDPPFHVPQFIPKTTSAREVFTKQRQEEDQPKSIIENDVEQPKNGEQNGEYEKFYF